MPEQTEHKRQQDSLISAEENRAMFDKIAGYYDGTNRILSLGLDGSWRRRAVACLSPQPGAKYLDVGCGTGDVSIEILRHAPGSAVVGIDASEKMLELGREKVNKLGLEHCVSLDLGDVLDLQFPDNHFDGAITSFCIRNVTDRTKGIAEICRVVRPGGLLVILELTEPTGFIMKPLFRVYAGLIMPLVTKIMSSVSAYRYLSASMADFPRPEMFTDLMAVSGFVNTRHTHMTGGIVTLFVGEVPAQQSQVSRLS
jgi:demethylmenaquinone methyltransferase/2-methoxy-6-polyprenyl-1,4-benzoquinol methylase